MFVNASLFKGQESRETVMHKLPNKIPNLQRKFHLPYELLDISWGEIGVAGVEIGVVGWK